MLADFDRPLAARGHEASARMAFFLAESGTAPDLALVSTARRTRETWDAVAPALPDVPVSFDASLYAAGQTDLIRRLRRMDDSIDSLLLIGHNPGLERLADTLGGGSGDRVALDRLARKYPTAALAELSLDIPSWGGLDPGCGRIDRFTRPVDLDGLDDDD